MALASLALTALPARAQEAPALPPGVEVHMTATPSTASVGDLIRLQLEIRMPQGYEATVPPPGNQIGEFGIHEFYPGPAAPTTSAPEKGKTEKAEISPDGRKIHRAGIVVALYRVGTFEFPPIPWILRDGRGGELRASTPPVKIEIQSVLQAQDEKLRDLKQQAEIREPVRWVLWLLTALALVLLAILAWWWWQRRQRPAIPAPVRSSLDPFALAAAELRDLLGRGLLEKGFVKQHYVALSEIIKKVLEAGYRVQTAEKTTSEILENLRLSEGRGSDADIQRIGAFLYACDLVKFAKYIPSKPENDAAIHQAAQILESCRRQHPAPPPEGAPETVGAS